MMIGACLSGQLRICARVWTQLAIETLTDDWRGCRSMPNIQLGMQHVHSPVHAPQQQKPGQQHLPVQKQQQGMKHAVQDGGFAIRVRGVG